MTNVTALEPVSDRLPGFEGMRTTPDPSSKSTKEPFHTMLRCYSPRKALTSRLHDTQNGNATLRCYYCPPLLSSFWIMLRCRCFEQQRVGGGCYCCLSCSLVTVGCNGWRKMREREWPFVGTTAEHCLTSETKECFDSGTVSLNTAAIQL